VGTHNVTLPDGDVRLNSVEFKNLSDSSTSSYILTGSPNTHLRILDRWFEQSRFNGDISVTIHDAQLSATGVSTGRFGSIIVDTKVPDSESTLTLLDSVTRARKFFVGDADSELRIVGGSYTKTIFGSLTSEVLSGAKLLTSDTQLDTDLLMNGAWSVARPTTLVGRLDGSGTVSISGTLGGNLRLENDSTGIDEIDVSFAGSGSVEVAQGQYQFNGSNSISGGLIVSGGELLIASGSRTGALDNTIVMSGGMLTLTGSMTLATADWQIDGTGSEIDTRSHQVTITGDIAGAGQLRKVGEGALVLTGNNGNFAGEFLVSDGSLFAGAGNSLGSATRVTLDNTSLTLQGNEDFGALAGNGAVNLVGFDAGFKGDEHTEFAGIVSGSGSLTHDGVGSLRLSGNLQVMAGPLNVDQGNLILERFTITDYTGDITTKAPGAVTLDTAGGDRTYAGTLVNRGRLVKTGGGVLTVNDISNDGGTVEVTEGVLASDAIQGDHLILSGGTFRPTVGNLAYDTIHSSDDTVGTLDIAVGSFRVRDSLSGAGTIIKTGVGRFEFFSATNNAAFTGAFDVQQGTLQLSRSLQNARLNLSAGGLVEVTVLDREIGSLAGSGAVQLIATDPEVTAKLRFGGDDNDTAFDGQVFGEGDFVKEGAGEFTFNGNASQLVGQFVIKEGVVAGEGTFGDLLVGGGSTLAPGQSAGRITTDDLTLQAGGILQLELGGLIAGEEFDQLVIHQDVSIDGELSVTLIDGLELAAGRSFLVATIGGTRSGEFAGLPDGATVGAFTGFDLFIDYGAGDGNDIALHTAVVTLPGDYNNDGVVDAVDYAVWRDNLSAPAGTLPNDTVGGIIGLPQYETWVANFGATQPAPLTGVPEPSTLTILSLSACCLLRRRRRQRFYVD